LLIGLVGLVFFSFLIGLTVTLPQLEPDSPVAYSILFATICACVFGAGSVGSIYLLVAFQRRRLSTSDEIVRYVGVVRRKAVPLAEITRAVWGGWPVGGRLMLYTNGERLVIQFGNYTDPGDLASFFRAVLPIEVQERYERFESTCAPATEAFRRRQGREDRFFIVLLPLLGLGLVVLAFWDPYDIRQWCAAPMAFTIVMGIKAVYTRWRAGWDVPSEDKATSEHGGQVAEPGAAAEGGRDDGSSSPQRRGPRAVAEQPQANVPRVSELP